MSDKIYFQLCVVTSVPGYWVEEAVCESKRGLWRLMLWPELRPGRGSIIKDGGNIDVGGRTNKPAGQGATCTL